MEMEGELVPKFTTNFFVFYHYKIRVNGVTTK